MLALHKKFLHIAIRSPGIYLESVLTHFQEDNVTHFHFQEEVQDSLSLSRGGSIAKSVNMHYAQTIGWRKPDIVFVYFVF